MKLEIKKVEVRGAERPGDLFDEAVGRIMLAENKGKNETGWFPRDGLFWNLTADIIIHTTTIQYDCDTPSEVDKTEVGVLFRAFECMNEEGGYVGVVFLDENSREFSAEDVLVKRIEDYYEDYYYSNL